MSIRGTVAKIRAKTFIRRLYNRFFGIRCSIFRTLEVIFSRSKVQLLSYEQKRSFACFESGFSSFAVLFLALCRLFCVDWRYSCQDTGENAHSPS